jgi:hypothetical protein
VIKDSLLHAAVCHERALLVGCTARRELWLALAGRNRKAEEESWKACNGRQERAVPAGRGKTKQNGRCPSPLVPSDSGVHQCSASTHTSRARTSLPTGGGGLGWVGWQPLGSSSSRGVRGPGVITPRRCVPLVSDLARLQNFLSLALHDHGPNGTADSAASSPGNHHDHGAVPTYVYMTVGSDELGGVSYSSLLQHSRKKKSLLQQIQM